MFEDPTVTFGKPEAADRRLVTATITDELNPWPITLYFIASGRGEGPPPVVFHGFQVLSGESVDPASFARVTRNLPWYVRTARALLLLDRARAQADYDSALEELRLDVGKYGRRGVPRRTISAIAEKYNELVRQGDRNPIGTLAKTESYHRSTIWRHIQKARSYGMIEEPGPAGGEGGSSNSRAAHSTQKAATSARSTKRRRQTSPR